MCNENIRCEDNKIALNYRITNQTIKRLEHVRQFAGITDKLKIIQGINFNDGKNFIKILSTIGIEDTHIPLIIAHAILPDIIVTGDVGTDNFIYLDKSPDKEHMISEKWMKIHNKETISLPGGADAFKSYLNTRASSISYKALNPCNVFKGVCRAYPGICKASVHLPTSTYILTQKEKQKMKEPWSIEMAFPSREFSLKHCGTPLDNRIEEYFESVKKKLIKDKENIQQIGHKSKDFFKRILLFRQDVVIRYLKYLEETIPALIVECNLGWRKKGKNTNNDIANQLGAFLKERNYIIRTHDPTYEEWKKLRKDNEDIQGKGIWFSTLSDIADGNLKVSGVWEDIQDWKNNRDDIKDTDLIKYLKKDITLCENKEWLHHIVILIGREGVLIIKKGKKDNGTLLIMPKEQPESFMMKEHRWVIGRNIIFSASLVDAICHKKFKEFGPSLKELKHEKCPLENSAREGLIRIRRLIQQGYLQYDDVYYTLSENLSDRLFTDDRLNNAHVDDKLKIIELVRCILKNISEREKLLRKEDFLEKFNEIFERRIEKIDLTLNHKDEIKDAILKRIKKEFNNTDAPSQDKDIIIHKYHTNLPFMKLEKIDDKDTKAIIRFTNKKKERDTKEDAMDIVSQDDEALNRRIVFEVGKFKTISHENAKEIIRLAGELEENLHYEDKIYSCAIFGGPGSGKSFLTKELIKSIKEKTGLPITEKITFNLSQFDNTDKLINAFKEIQEHILKGEIPFVIWDEFDSNFNNKRCGWLTYFLMPMQDRQFFDGNENRDLGRCIFVFSGGTFKGEEDFIKWAKTGDGKELKGEDFHSRLDSSITVPTVELKCHKKYGYLCSNILVELKCHKKYGYLCSNILNVEQDEAISTRALVIRHFLKKYTDVKNISMGVLIYLLHIQLQHGIRSIEKIIQNSELRYATTFRIEHLPPLHTLELHVKEGEVHPHVPIDPKKFLKCLDLNEENYQVELQLEWRGKSEYKILELQESEYKIPDNFITDERSKEMLKAKVNSEICKLLNMLIEKSNTRYSENGEQLLKKLIKPQKREEFLKALKKVLWGKEQQPKEIKKLLNYNTIPFILKYARQRD